MNLDHLASNTMQFVSDAMRFDGGENWAMHFDRKAMQFDCKTVGSTDCHGMVHGQGYMFGMAMN